ncbi:protein of unknown function [Tistlia consotensis]|uniref:DUF3291 domain-containing protein n=1 Tax=Tistlia consotensis USBA 355 TaxID=560819 RepID=A0A1Y6CQ54_9PROT|nr:DUF3291 domain-containing protein [Tistlia consotensis]SMF67284.1 protein of unknown function [Tistlia consotensis USBA 355]SNS00080.1 protein of unknown function [Tistlia consotensis]
MASELAQINVGRTLYPLDDPRMDGFTGRLDAVNALAEAAPGFVWRLQSDSGNATDIKVSDDPQFIVNLSVWRDAEALFDFVYRTRHREVMVQRRQWFEPPKGVFQALWWVPAGHRPTPQEGLAAIARLEAEGPTPAAFSFKQRFAPPEAQGGAAEGLDPAPWCVGWS